MRIRDGWLKKILGLLRGGFGGLQRYHLPTIRKPNSRVYILKVSVYFYTKPLHHGQQVVFEWRATCMYRLYTIDSIDSIVTIEGSLILYTLYYIY